LRIEVLTYTIYQLNNPNKLKKLLDSIPNICDIEVIVVDDRSDKQAEKYIEIKEEYSMRNIIIRII